MPIEKRAFFEGMDGDTSQRLLSDKAALNIMNGRMAVTKYGRNFRVENTPGTTLISQSVYPPYGVHQCIGSATDEARGRVIYALWNSMDDHGIYCYDIATNTTFAVLYDSQVIGGLNFSKSFRIDRNAKVVGDILYWTDYLNQPRRINIEAGIKMNHSSYDTDVAPYSWPMNESVIALIRRPFGLNITATKVTDGAVSNNFLAPFAGQFASRFVYRDDEISVMSVPSNQLSYSYSTDTSNAIDVVFDLNEDIEQDVQIVQLAVRFNNDPSYFVIKEWNKEVPADATEIANHNSGSSALTFRFYNDKNGIAISDADSVKPEDSVPILVRTLETGLNRLFLSNYIKGYNAPSVTSLTGTATQSSAVAAVQTVFKAYSSHQIGIRFRDYYSRKSSIVTNDDLLIDIIDRGHSYTPYVTDIAWTLSNAAAVDEIPDWAYYYDIVITKNLRTRYFIQFGADLQYAKKNSDGTYSYQDTYDSTIFGIGISMGIYNAFGGGYVFSEGDVARLYFSALSTLGYLKVLAQDANYVIVSPVDIGSLAVQPGAIFEIYTPYTLSGTETFYTTGSSYLVSNSGTISRQYSTTAGNIQGDTVRSDSILGELESMSPNFAVNPNVWYAIFGQSGIVSLFGQVNKDSFVQFSNVFIQGSNANGLSTFDALDETSLPNDLGAISKLQLASKIQEEGNIMLAIGERATASLYLGEVQLVGASSNAFVAQASGVIGTVNVLKNLFGTTHPETVFEYLGIVFFLDVNKQVFVQYSNSGLEDVSRYRMSRFFKNYCTDYLESNANNLDNINGFHHIPTGVDPFHKEVIATLPGLIYENYADVLPSYSSVPSYATSIINRFDIVDRLAKTMAFQYEENKWGSNFEFMAEWYENSQNILFGWQDGNLYTFNTNTTNWNTYFGVEYPVRICVTGNLNPSALKVLNNIAIESNLIPNYTVAYTDYPNVQITDLASTDEQWEDQEGQFYADFLKDRLSPNASGTADDKMQEGDDLTDIVIKVMCEWQAYDSLFYCNFIDIGYSLSRGQKQIMNPINE